jgi:hypothetical protein
LSLAETQSIFWNALQGDVDEAEIDRCFVGSTDLPALERVEIYGNMYVWRIVDALREEFPKVASLLGDDAFFDAMAEYIGQEPSESPDLGQMGRRLPEFLKSYAGPPGLADLAALEWARSQVFLEADAPSAAATALAGVASEDVPAVRLQVIPALRLLSFEHSPLQVWQQIEDGEPPGVPDAAAGHAAVWRREFDVFHVSLNTEEAEALRRCVAGEPLERVCDAFAGHDDAATTAFAAIASWFAEGWISGVTQN